MQEYLKDRLWVHLRRAATAVLASGAVAAATLPALAQQACEAMFLYDQLRDPQLETVSLLTSQDSAFTVAGLDDAPRARDYPVIDTLTAYELGRIFDVKQVRAQPTKGDTGTTFMLTDSGRYVIRRPAVELIHPMMVIPPN